MVPKRTPVVERHHADHDGDSACTDRCTSNSQPPLPPRSQSSAGMAVGLGHIKPRRSYAPEGAKCGLASTVVASAAHNGEKSSGCEAHFNSSHRCLHPERFLFQGIRNADTVRLPGHAKRRVAHSSPLEDGNAIGIAALHGNCLVVCSLT